MPIRSLMSVAATIVAVAASSSAYANSSMAVAECQAAVQNDSRFNGARDTNAHQVSKGVFKVTGLVQDERNRDHRYTCRYEYGEVVSYNVTDSSVAESNQKAAAVGAGLIGLAAVAAIVKHEDDENHRKNRDSYYKGNNYAFDDRNYLKRECSEEVRAHIDRDHGKVASIDLQAPYVHDRVMSGTGEVYFRNGGSRELRYTCNFDRGGQIYDGRYSYVSAGYPGHSDYSGYDYNGNRGGSSEYKRGFSDGRHGREFDAYKHPQDYKDGYRDGERARWEN
jgi:hypothetical protein